MRRAFYNKCALKINRAPENRSAARFLGKRSGRRSGQDGKHSAPSAMAPWRDERTAGFPLDLDNFFRQLERIFVREKTILKKSKPRF